MKPRFQTNVRTNAHRPCPMARARPPSRPRCEQVLRAAARIAVHLVERRFERRDAVMLQRAGQRFDPALEHDALVHAIVRKARATARKQTQHPVGIPAAGAHPAAAERASGATARRPRRRPPAPSRRPRGSMARDHRRRARRHRAPAPSRRSPHRARDSSARRSPASPALRSRAHRPHARARRCRRGCRCRARCARRQTPPSAGRLRCWRPRRG